MIFDAMLFIGVRNAPKRITNSFPGLEAEFK